MNTLRRQKIGIFDSGVGGLSVFQHAVNAFPDTDIEYLADTKRYPYGEKTESQICDYLKEIFCFFSQRHCSALIIACSTASGVFQKNSHFETFFPGVIVTMLNEDLCLEVARLTRNRKIGILSTSLTKKVNQFAQYLKHHLPEIDVFCNAAPGLVDLVTEGATDGNFTIQTAEDYLKPLLLEGIDTLVIGCTHFHFVTPVLEKVCGEKISLVAPAPLSVRHLKKVLPLAGKSQDQRNISIFTTGEAADFYRQATRTAKIRCSFDQFQKISLCRKETLLSCEPVQF